MPLEKQLQGIPWALRVVRSKLFPKIYLEEEAIVQKQSKAEPEAPQKPLQNPPPQVESATTPKLPLETQELGEEMVLSSGIKARYSPGYEPTPRRRVDMDPFPEGDIVVDSLFRPAHSEANLSPQEKARRTKGGRS